MHISLDEKSINPYETVRLTISSIPKRQSKKSDKLFAEHVNSRTLVTVVERGLMLARIVEQTMIDRRLSC